MALPQRFQDGSLNYSFIHTFIYYLLEMGPQTHSVTEDGLELLIFLPLPQGLRLQCATYVTITLASCDAQTQTQGLGHDMQALYQLSYIPSSGSPNNLNPS